MIGCAARLVSMHQNTQVVDVAAGSALKAAWEVMVIIASQPRIIS